MKVVTTYHLDIFTLICPPKYILLFGATELYLSRQHSSNSPPWSQPKQSLVANEFTLSRPFLSMRFSIATPICNWFDREKIWMSIGHLQYVSPRLLHPNDEKDPAAIYRIAIGISDDTTTSRYLSLNDEDLPGWRSTIRWEIPSDDSETNLHGRNNTRSGSHPRCSCPVLEWYSRHLIFRLSPWCSKFIQIEEISYAAACC